LDAINGQGSKKPTTKVAGAMKKVLGDKTHCLFSHLAIQFNLLQRASTKTSPL
jgi:hypothetical protein